ncbi:MAG: C1 family peptidase [Armatimonadota bacterium]
MLLEFDQDVLRLLSIIAIALAAWFGGFWPGMLATAVGLLGTIVTRTDVSPPLFDITHGIRLLLAFSTGLIVSALTEALSRTSIAWRQSVEAQENRVLQERNRMAREIHDTLAQGLTGIIIQLEAAEDILADSPDQSGVRAHIARAQDLARVSLAEARHSVSVLRPLALEGRSLPEALSDRLLKMTAGTNVDVSLEVVGTPYTLTADCEDNLLRLGLEAVTNALKHAHPHTVRIRLVFSEGDVSLVVRDDGDGFSPQPRTGFGLLGMQERADRIGGRFGLSSSPGFGTEVQVTVNTTVIPPVSLPTSYQLLMPPVRNQGTEGSCVSFAAVYAARSAEQFYSSNATTYSDATNVFSPEFVFNQVNLGGTCTSSSVVPTLDLMKNSGVCTWQVMPYSTYDGCSLMPSSGQTSNALNYKIAAYSTIIAADNIAIKTMLINKHPVIATINIDQQFYEAKQGFIWNSFTSNSGYHAVTLCGYDDSKRAYKAINSWGANWGDGGYVWIDYDFFPTVSSYYTYSISL